MPQPSRPQGDNFAVVLERIEQLRCDMAEVRDAVKSVVDWRGSYEKESAVVHSQLDAKATDAHKRIDRLETQVAALTSSVQGLTTQIAAMNQKLTLIAGGLGFICVTVGGWLIGRLLGLL